MDPLSQVLNLISLQAQVYFCAGFHAPWGMQIPSSPYAAFHFVQCGNCVLRVGDRIEALKSGDIVVLPYGHAHELYEGQPGKLVPGAEVLRSIKAGKPVIAGGPNATCRITCGHFEFDRTAQHPLARALPATLIVRDLDDQAIRWTNQLADLLLQEFANQSAGTTEIINRLAESLFIQVLRTYISRESTAGFLAALSDNRLSVALQIIHSENRAKLSLNSLANRCGMSRSNLAEQFKSAVGMTPMRYATVWQLMKARKRLESTKTSVAVIAEECGYRSEAAFSRAFKAFLGKPPSAVRREL